MQGHAPGACVAPCAHACDAAPPLLVRQAEVHDVLADRLQWRAAFEAPAFGSVRQTLTGWRQQWRFWLCGMHGHERQIHNEDGYLSLRCAFCGQVSRGWAVGAPRLARRLEGDPARHRLVPTGRGPAVSAAPRLAAWGGGQAGSPVRDRTAGAVPTWRNLQQAGTVPAAAAWRNPPPLGTVPGAAEAAPDPRHGGVADEMLRNVADRAAAAARSSPDAGPVPAPPAWQKPPHAGTGPGRGAGPGAALVGALVAGAVVGGAVGYLLRARGGPPSDAADALDVWADRLDRDADRVTALALRASRLARALIAELDSGVPAAAPAPRRAGAGPAGGAPQA